MTRSTAENLARRAEIGAERRARSRRQILRAAVGLYGTPEGGGVRLQDICAASGTARGTFYNHFASLDAFQQEFSDEVSREFDRAMNAALPRLAAAAERNAATLRYYLHAGRQNPEWGWALVHTVKAPTFFGQGVFENAARVIQTGIDSGEFDLESASLGRDLLFGAAYTAMQRLLSGAVGADYPEMVAARVLRAFGLTAEAARAAAACPLPALDAGPASAEAIIAMPRLVLP